MTDEQVPFEFPDLVSNPEPRCPCILLLDTSGSMSGRPLAELNEGVRTPVRGGLRAVPERC